MLAYLGTFAVSVGLTFWAETLRKKDKRKEGGRCLFLALLFVILLAGLRDYRVGTDTWNYVGWVEKAAGYENFLDYVKSWYTGREILSCAIVYTAAKLGFARFFYLAIAAVTYSAAMAALVMMRETVSLPYAWAAYLFFMYGISLNQTRQSVSMTLMLCAFAFLLRKKYVWTAVLLVAALLFHSSALLALVIFALYLILQRWDTKAVRVVIVVAALLSTIFAVPLLRLILATGITGGRFTSYLDHMKGQPFTLNPVILRLPFFIMPMFFYRDFAREENAKSYTFKKQDADFLLILLIIEMAVAMLRMISSPIFRLSFYFEAFRCVAIGRMMHTLEMNPERQKWAKLLRIALFAMFVIIWIYQNIYRLNDGMFPYTSEILGISRGPLAVMMNQGG